MPEEKSMPKAQEDLLKKERFKKLAIKVENIKIKKATCRMRKCGYGKLEIVFYAGKATQINELKSLKL